MRLPRADTLAKLHEGYVLEWHRGMLSTGWFWLRKEGEDPIDVPLQVGRALVKRQLVTVLQVLSTQVRYTYKPAGTRKLPRYLKVMVQRMINGDEYFYETNTRRRVPGIYRIRSLRDIRRLNDAGFPVHAERAEADQPLLRRITMLDYDIFVQRARDLGFL